MSMSWINSDRPDIHSVIALDQDAVEVFDALYRESPHGLDIERLERILLQEEFRYFGQITPPDNPMIVRDEETGAETAYQVWCAPIGERKPGYEHIPSPDYTLVLVSDKQTDEHGHSTFMPQMLLRGKNTDAMIVGGMTCCGDVGIQTHWTQDLGEEEGMIDAPLVPLDNMMNDDHSHWLQGKVHKADSDVLLHILQHVMAHCFPNNPIYAHDCASEADVGAYMASLNKLSPS